jgi:hypothetical protein
VSWQGKAKLSSKLRVNVVKKWGDFSMYDEDSLPSGWYENRRAILLNKAAEIGCTENELWRYRMEIESLTLSDLP